MRILFFLLVPFLSIAQKTPALFVNPFIGTGGHGHTFPGATLPFGMVQLSPDTRVDGSWDGCSGYHYSDSIIYGFSHTHLSGTGVSDYGDILLMPMNLENASAEKLDYPSKFSHKKEKAGAGWYEVYLEKHQVMAEFTASTRVGFHRYTYKGKNAAIVLDLKHRDELLEGKIEQIDAYRIRGMRRSKAWANDQVVYYEMEFSQKITNIKGSSKSELGDLNAIFEFRNMSSTKLEVKVGLSFASQEGAHLNLTTEAKAINFDQAKQNAISNWSTELNRIQVQGGTDEQKHIFYTALYHTMIQPNIASDVDGNYRGMDKKNHHAEHPVYSVFSLWDTFRAAHPLYSILFPQRQADFIKTFLLMYQQGGRLPVWELAANETDCMIGYHSVSVIADSWSKGIHDFDSTLALEAMLKSANWNHLGLPQYKAFGHLTVDDEPESVSKTLEYAYDDWCIAQFAETLGDSATAQKYYLRSQGWKHLFDQTVGTSTGFMRPKKNGAWLNPFDPYEVNNNYTEANSWQYSFFVPHDLKGLASMYSSTNLLISKLNLAFTTNSKTTGREQLDITGLIGQYAHGNEPSHHMAWMFTELGQPETSQKYVRQILNELYTNNPDGLSGNEDCGQMSAWYVLSSMGFYPFCPGKPLYTIGNPLFNEVQITPSGGTPFTIKTSGTGAWITSVNGTNRFELDHSDIVAGKTILLERSDTPPLPVNPNFMKFPGKQILPAPVISTSQMVFRDSLIVSVMPPELGCRMFYTTNGIPPNLDKSAVPIGLGEEIRIVNSCQFQVMALKDSLMSPITNAVYFKIPHNYTVEIKSKYNPQYSAGGDQGIIDGLNADENWRKGGWQGYQAQDFECIVDLQKNIPVQQVSASFLQDTRSWIVFPTNVQFLYSTDKENWKEMGIDEPTVKPEDYTIQRWESRVPLELNDGKPDSRFIFKPINARYLKVKAKNFGKLPDWHMGAGGDAFIFIDEIWVK